MTPEGRIKKKVKAELAQLGEKCWQFMPVQTGFGVPALDFITCINSWFVAIETKKDAKAKLTPMQQATKRTMEAAGALVFAVYDDASLDRAMKVIRSITRVNNNGHVRDLAKPWIDVINAEEAPGQDQQHPSTEQPAQAADQATGRDHGAPRKKPQRPAKPAARRDDPAVTATVTRCTCQSVRGSMGVPLIQICAYCNSKGW